MRVFAPLLLLATTISGTAAARDYGPYPSYEGPRVPASAAVFSSLATSASSLNATFRTGYFLEVDGDGKADVVDEIEIDPQPFGVGTLWAVYVSPSNRNLYYALAEKNDGNPGTQGILAIERTPTGYRLVVPFVALPQGVHELRGPGASIARLRGRWTGISGVRRLPDGRDALLVVATQGNVFNPTPFRSSFAVLVGGGAHGAVADHWAGASRLSIELPYVEAMTLDGSGRVLARRVASDRSPAQNTELFTIRDLDGDALPETVDAGSVLPEPGQIFSAGPADVDVGADRLVMLFMLTTADLDSLGRPVSKRRMTPATGGGQPIADLYDLHVAADGSMVGYGPGVQVDRNGIHRFRDVGFDNVVNAFEFLSPEEHFYVVFDDEFPNNFLNFSEAPPLEHVPLPGGSATIRFRDYGEFPGGEAFSFPFGSFEGSRHESLVVGANGTVRFGSSAPVSGPASAEALRSLQGVIAPAWSDAWDASRTQVFAGYAPVQTGFDQRSRVLAFVVEWQGMRNRAWPDLGVDATRQFSMRLVLFSDGTWRTDYGALGDVTGTPFVVGYSGPGLAATTATLDASAHSWGAAPAGTGSERFLAEAFASGNDLGHRWLRWSGYPTRLDEPGPAPVLAGLRVKKGKLLIPAAGSNIVEGARAIVDGVETFALGRNAAGTKWVVKKFAVSTPGGRTVAQIWSDGAAHSVVVENPDGARSAPASVTR